MPSITKDAAPEQQPRRYTRAEIAKKLGEYGFPVSASTLSVKACRGGGPPFTKFGKHVFYDLEQTLAWANSLLVEVPAKPRQA